MSAGPIYTLRARLWHWVQALTILVLMATGAEIHAPETFRWLGFTTAVRVHNAFALILVLNAVLGMMYFLATGLIRQYLPRRGDFFVLAVRQAQFYLHGMFRGDEHPMEEAVHRRLNPLQQVTYLVILNLLLPLQLATGVLIWGAQRWPTVVERLGGLTALVPLHALAAGLFLAFLIAHVYLITTGESPLQYLRAMVDGGRALDPAKGASR